MDIAGVCDATQTRQVFRQWAQNPRSRVEGARSWSGRWRRSAASARRRTTSGSVHDFMHAKVTVADDVVFLGSFNLSRSGEMNAENVLEIADPALAERLAAWIDGLRARYPDGI